MICYVGMTECCFVHNLFAVFISKVTFKIAIFGHRVLCSGDKSEKNSLWLYRVCRNTTCSFCYYNYVTCMQHMPIFESHIYVCNQLTFFRN